MRLPPPPSPRAAAFVLAGGRSSRMGQEKANISVGGKPLIERALQILRDAGLEPKIGGARSEFSEIAQTIPDDPCSADRGPLSGICASLISAGGELAVFTPVDLPLLPPSVIEGLLHHAEITESAVTLVSVSGFIQTFPAVIRRDTLSYLSQSLQSDNRNCLRAFRAAAGALSKAFTVVPVELFVQARQISNPSGLPPSAWFLNVNSREDLSRAEALLIRTVFK